MIWAPSISPPVSSAPSCVQTSSMAKYSSPLRAMATMRLPNASERVSPSPKFAGPASIQLIVASHHSGLQPRFVRHHAVIPRRIEDQLDVGSRHRGHQLYLVTHVLHQNLAHAAARGGERHLDGDVARLIGV